MNNYIFYPPQQNYHNNQKIDLGDFRILTPGMTEQDAAMVIFNGYTLVDMTMDTVNPNVVFNGYTFHASNGWKLKGTYDPVDVTQDTVNPNVVLNGYTFHDANKLPMVGTLVPPPNINYDNMVIVHDKTNGDYAFGNCAWQTGYIPSAEKMFASNSLFNNSITIGNNVKNCYQMLYQCRTFNSPINIGKNVNNVIQMCYYCDNFNQSPLIFPNYINNFYQTMSYCTNFQGNIYVENTYVANVKYMLQETNVAKRKNIYCTNLDCFRQTSSSYSITGTSMRWYSDPSNNCYYNTTYNIYLYNYLPENYV